MSRISEATLKKGAWDFESVKASGVRIVKTSKPLDTPSRPTQLGSNEQISTIRMPVAGKSLYSMNALSLENLASRKNPVKNPLVPVNRNEISTAL